MKEKLPSIRKQNPAIPQSVENILLKAAAKNPRNRYESAKDMHEDLLHCLDEDHANDKKISFEYPENDIDSDEPIKVEQKKVETPTNKELEEFKTEEIAKEIDDFADLKEELKEEEEISDNDSFENTFNEPRKKNTLIIILASFLLILLICGGIFWLITTKEVEDVTVPNVVGYTVEEAIDELTKNGFTFTTEQKNSSTIEEGKVIKTSPRAGSTRKKGDTITLYESIGGSYYYLENYIKLDYKEVKAKLELLGINVLIEKEDIEQPEKYKGKEDLDE